jgi:hypothetical protein
MDDIPNEKLRKIVRQFLNDFKILVLEKGLNIENRQKNRDGLLELGLTAYQREEIILSLSLADYYAGPKKDKYKSGYYWEFGKRIDGVEVYIKLKIVEYNEDEYAVCFSFHRSEYQLNFPFVD